jgi:hypothetical protein
MDHYFDGRRCSTQRLMLRTQNKRMQRRPGRDAEDGRARHA